MTIDYESFALGAGMALMPCIAALVGLFRKVSQIDRETREAEARMRERREKFCEELRRIMAGKQCVCTDASNRIYERRK